MKSLSPKIVFHLQVLMVCGASMMASKSIVTATCSCYKFYNHSKTWDESRIDCKDGGGHLVTMETEEEWKFITTEIQNRSTILNEWYIGLKYESNVWKWINDDSNLTFNKWQPNQPSKDGKCVVMAKNYPNGTTGLWNDLPCNKDTRGFICEYEQDVKCNSSKMFVCEQKTKPTGKSDTKTACTATVTVTDRDQFNLIYVVIVLGILLACGIGFYIYIFYCKNRNTGFSLRCRKYKSCESKTRTSTSSQLILEEGAAPAHTELTTETIVEDDRMITTDGGNSAEPQDPAQDITVEDVVNPDYSSPADPSAISPYASLYATVKGEQKKPEEIEDIIPPKMPSPYKKASEEPAVYATVDKSRKKGQSSCHVEVVYATVDKKRKTPEDNS